MLQAATTSHHSRLRRGQAMCPPWRPPRRRSRRQHGLGAFTWTGAADTGAALAPPSASPTFNFASGIAGQGAGLASSAGLFSGATGALGTVGAALPFVGAGLAAAGIGVNLIQCGTISQIGCEKVAQTKANEAAHFAGAAALWYAFQGNASIANTALAQMAKFAQQEGQGDYPSSWGVYFKTTNAGFDQPNPFASVHNIANNAAFRQAKAAVAGRQLTFADMQQLVGQVLARGGKPTMSVAQGSPIQAKQVRTAATVTAAATPAASTSSKSSVLPLALGAGALALFLI